MAGNHGVISMATGKGMWRQKKSEHAQAALDFLMEYGWAIALIVIIAAVFYALGIFDPASWLGSHASGFSGVAARGWYLAPDGTFSIKVANQAGKPILIDSIELTINNQTVNISGSAAKLERGEESGILYTSPGAFGPQKGGSYIVIVHVRYIDLDTDFPYETTGTLTGRAWHVDVGVGGNQNNQTNQSNQTQNNQTSQTNQTMNTTTNQTNNSTASLPDMVVYGYSLSALFWGANGPIANIGVPFSVDLTTWNRGNGTAGPSHTHFWTPFYDNLVPVPQLAPGNAITPPAAGSSYLSHFSLTCTAPGIFNLYATADSQNEVAESDENNNGRPPNDALIQMECGAATLTVTKHVINDNGGMATASSFTMRVNATNGSVSFPGVETGVNIAVSAGAYSVSEDNVSGYASSTSSGCSGATANGEHKTCTITNNDIASNQTNQTNATLSWCYQENPAVGVPCAPHGGGAVICTSSGVWDGTHTCAQAIDGDWNSYGSSSTFARLFLNYYIPTGADSSSLWQVKGPGGAYANISIDPACMTEQPLTLYVLLTSEPAVHYSCFSYATRSWHELSSDHNGELFYDAAMWWHINGGG